MNLARRFLIPFPPVGERPFNPDDTVYAIPHPELLFRPAPRTSWMPATISRRVGIVAVGLAFVAGAAASRVSGSIWPAAAHADDGAAPASISAGSPALEPALAASSPLSPATQARLRKIHFRLSESRKFQRVGPFSIRLNKADHKRQTFTLTLQMKGKQVQLQDRALAEAIRLQPAGSTQNEILVQRIDSDQVEGYVQVRGSR